MQNGWIEYNHMLIPAAPPHSEIDMTPIEDKSIWKNAGGGYPVIARWTTEFDCGHDTEWWYVIKDSPFDISTLKAKRRYEINKGLRYFEVKRIEPDQYTEELLAVQIDAFSAWPEKYRPLVDAEKFKKDIGKWRDFVVYGGFHKETGELAAYVLLSERPEVLEFNVLRSRPVYEREGINAAMVYAFINDYNTRLSNEFYILDGERAIRHETAFQDYLEKYFGFRKAYCKLNVAYRFPINIAVKLLYPFRLRIKSDTRLGSMLSAVLKMEHIRRNC